MRTKTLFLTAALVAAGIASSMAQATVYSVNAVGYVNVPMPVGINFYANPLIPAVNDLTILGVPEPDASGGTTVGFWDTTSQDYLVYTYFGGGFWFPDNAPGKLSPGSGFYVSPNKPFTNTFVGEVPQGHLTTPIPVSNPVAGSLSLVSSQVPQDGDADSLGLTDDLSAGGGETLLKWDAGLGDYLTFTYFGGGFWFPSTPAIRIAESVFIRSTTAETWTRDFQVSP